MNVSTYLVSGGNASSGILTVTIRPNIEKDDSHDDAIPRFRLGIQWQSPPRLFASVHYVYIYVIQYSSTLAVQYESFVSRIREVLRLRQLPPMQPARSQPGCPILSGLLSQNILLCELKRTMSTSRIGHVWPSLAVAGRERRLADLPETRIKLRVPEA
jgi:hypothetical protein